MRHEPARPRRRPVALAHRRLQRNAADRAADWTAWWSPPTASLACEHEAEVGADHVGERLARVAELLEARRYDDALAEVQRQSDAARRPTSRRPRDAHETGPGE